MPKPKPHQLRNRKVRVSLNIEKAGYRHENILPEKHLFVSEGTKTEPLYLTSMVDFLAQKYGDGVKKQLVIYGGGDNTLNLLKKAEDWSSSDETGGFQHIWVIYDKDSFPGDDFDNTRARCRALNEKCKEREWNRTFHALWSNECFEVWFLFHYMFLSAGIPRSQYGETLSGLRDATYEKTAPPGFAELLPKLNDAIRNAKRQMANFDAQKPYVPPSKRNPCTNFYELMENLMPYIKAAQEAQGIEEEAKASKRTGKARAARRAENSS